MVIILTAQEDIITREPICPLIMTYRLPKSVYDNVFTMLILLRCLGRAGFLLVTCDDLDVFISQCRNSLL